MNNLQHMVRQFHSAFGHPVGVLPEVLTPERAAARLKWMREELTEFEDAVAEGDLEGAYDAMIDEVYFALGTLVEMGLDIDPGFLEVHRANMAKLWPDGVHLDEDGKVIKPEGWTPPSHTEFISDVRTTIYEALEQDDLA